jgi:hypothetical protein
LAAAAGSDRTTGGILAGGHGHCSAAADLDCLARVSA